MASSSRNPTARSLRERPSRRRSANQPVIASATPSALMPERDSVSTSDSPITVMASAVMISLLASGDDSQSRR